VVSLTCWSSVFNYDMSDQINNCPDVKQNEHISIYRLDRPFILTQDNRLIAGMPYLYTEGSYIAGVRIESISIADNMLYIELQELESGKMFSASWNLEYEGDYYLWTLADLPTIMSLTK